MISASLPRVFAICITPFTICMNAPQYITREPMSNNPKLPFTPMNTYTPKATAAPITATIELVLAVRIDICFSVFSPSVSIFLVAMLSIRFCSL